MNLDEIRTEIDAVDDELTKLFAKRMELAAEVAEYKRENAMNVYDPARERKKLADISAKLPDDLKEYGFSLYSLIFELSRSRQNRLLGTHSAICDEIESAIKNTPQLLPNAPLVACQGVEGAYSQLACDKVFTNPNIFYFKNFEAVFTAIEKGLCRYGVIPLENSTAGSVNKVYDLMMKHRFSIIKSVRIKIDHNLLALPGTKLSDIKEIYSHEQAINQCAGFLSKLTGVNVVAVANTALASEMVAKSGRKDVAALSSRSCAQLYGLQNIAASVQDKGNNRTRFICISKNLEIYPGSDKTSIMMILNHKPGALYKVLARLYTLGINVTKLESRPLPDREFEFMFYFDLDTSIYSEEYVQLMCELDELCEEFKYLGSYTEVI